MNDIYEYIIGFVDEGDIMNMLSVNKKFYDEKILLRVMNKRFPFLANFKLYYEKWRIFYIKMLFSIINLREIGIPYIPHKRFNPYKIFSQRKFNYNSFLRYSIELGKLYIPIEFDPDFYDRGFSKNEMRGDDGLKYAVRMKNFEFINLLIEKGAKNFNYVFEDAVRTGDINIVNFFLDKGATDFNTGLLGAVKGANIEMVKLMIDKADDFDQALAYALKRNQTEIIELLITKEIKNFNICLIGAAEGGNIELVKSMIDKGANDFVEAVIYALKKRHFDIVNLLLDKVTYFNSILKCAIKIGDLEFVKKLFDIRNFDLSGVDNDHFCCAVKYGHIKIVEFLFQYNEVFNKISNPELYILIHIACIHGNLEMVKFLYEKEIDHQYIWCYIRTAANMGHVDIIQYFIDQGYTKYEEILSDGDLHFDVIKMMIEKGAKNFDQVLNLSITKQDFKRIKFLSAIKKSFLNKNESPVGN